MMRRLVIVALDGSEKDGRAVAVATAIARLSESDLHLVRVVADPRRDSVGLAAPEEPHDAVVAERADANARLERWVASEATRADNAVTSAVLQSRDVAAALIEHAAQRNALVVVLGTRAPGARERAIAGSVADHVMRESTQPVVLVPPGAAFMEGRTPAITRVLVPLDDSSLSLRSLEFIIELPHATDLEYVLMEVIPGESGRARASERLQKTATWLRSRGARAVDVVVVQAPDVAAAIVQGVRDVLPDAIAMSTRGAGGLRRVIVGSVAEGVVRQSELPVMLLTPRVLAMR